MKVPNESPMSRALSVQVRVVGALLMREVLTRFGRHNIGFLWLFLEPMAFTLGVSTVWQALGSIHNSAISPWSFALTGYSVLLSWRNCGARTMKAMEPNMSLMFHRNVRPMDIYLARVLLELIGVTASFVCLAGIFIAMGLIPPPPDLLGVFFSWILLCWLSAALALVVGSLSEISDLIDRLWHIFVYLLFPISGAVFMVSWLSPSLQAIVWWVPMVHITEMLRESFMVSPYKAHYSIPYALSACIFLTFLGLLGVKTLSNRLEV
jgi:capsular polysaccharide transport system permease protein